VKEQTSSAVKRSKFFKKIESGLIQCTLCPRTCKIPEDCTGFCKVRKNIEGVLYSLNYGLSTYNVIEPVETNAVFHYYPGEQALALGTIGCNLDCSFCQAWEYSKIKSAESANVKFFEHHTPEKIVDKVKEKGLKVISWTFNDPMSWFEFVLDTAKIAKKNGIVSLFKSNHYVNEEPLKELADFVDIFSISIKSIENQFYKEYCSGNLDPVLNAAKLLKSLNKHIEISNLVVPTLNDSKEQFTKLISWVKENLGIETPLHFARFHPDYKLLSLPRTPISTINAARDMARSSGMKYVYAGNMFVDDDSNNSYCSSCASLLVQREGGRTTIVNKSLKKCDNCGHDVPMIFCTNPKNVESSLTYIWRDDIFSVHVQIVNMTNEKKFVLIQNIFDHGTENNAPTLEKLQVAPREKIRYTFNKINSHHERSIISFEKSLDVKVFENLDRAYYGLIDYKG
jgi:pyruvate formate lyase activating enzyme